jgi:plastocyanin
MWSPEEEVERCDVMGETPARVVFTVMALVASLCFAAIGLAAASGSPFERSPTASPPSPSVVITLYGDAGLGFGFGSTNITNPGPTLIIHVGDFVSLTLIAHDSLNHTWFIDYNNDTAVSAGERESPRFYPGRTVVWNFTADRQGTWTYRCGMHPSSMTGRIVILGPRPVSLTLYGDAGTGWGFTASSIREPGPHLVFLFGTNVSLTLIAHDSLNHTWFIDYNNDTAVSAGERESPPFYPGHTIVWKFTADRTGNYTYRCGIHLTSMTGLITIIGTQPPPPLPVTVPLITAIMLGGLGVVFVFAAAYHVRAVRQSKRKR